MLMHARQERIQWCESYASTSTGSSGCLGQLDTCNQHEVTMGWMRVRLHARQIAVNCVRARLHARQLAVDWMRARLRARQLTVMRVRLHARQLTVY